MSQSWRGIRQQTCHAPRTELEPHRHNEGYLALVLEGDYLEVSPDGLFAFGPATLIAHPGFHTHANRFGINGARVLNMPWPTDVSPLTSYRAVRLSKTSSLQAVALQSPARAAQEAWDFLSGPRAVCRPVTVPSWATALAVMLRRDTVRAERAVLIRDQARRAGKSPEHVARCFQAFFGLSPVAYRREHRVRRALGMLIKGLRPAEVAAECGFCDQSHLNRNVREVTGYTPSEFARIYSLSHQFRSRRRV